MRLSLEPFGSTDMDVTIEIFPDRLAACLRHVGSYDHAGPTYERLFRWAASAELLACDAVVMGLSYDDPGAVAEDALRYDVCLALTEPVALPVGFRLETVRGGRYAVHALRGPYSGIHDAFRRLFGKWLPTSGEEVDDRPCLELHMSRPTEVPESERLTKVCVPLRNKPPRSTTELTPDARSDNEQSDARPKPHAGRDTPAELAARRGAAGQLSVG
jgi:AraC family transcriptional regulator